MGKNLAGFLTLSLIMILLSGCVTRSISDSGYRTQTHYGYQSTNPFYKGELSEFDVLGINPAAVITEDQIQNALKKARPLSLDKGASLLVIQSGASTPDHSMVQALEKNYRIAVFSGIPSESDSVKRYSKTIRLAAAQGGYGKILVYWGFLETSNQNLATKTISWVPVVGWIVPDETQHMRIRMKVALLDTASGSWDLFSPKAFDNTELVGHFSRESSDQNQVAILKNLAYIATADKLGKRYHR